MSLDYPPQVFRPPFRQAFRLPFRSPAGIEGLISQAIGDYNEDGIVTDGSGFVTAWNNSASIAGALPALDTVVGTLANSSVIDVNGHDAISSTGNYSLESSSGGTVGSPGIVFAVARFTAAAPGANQNIIASRSDVNARWLIYSRKSQADRFTFFQGTHSTMSEAYDTNPHVVTGRFNGNAASQLTFSDIGSLITDAGNQDFDFGTIFADRGGDSTLVGYIARLLVFNITLSEAQIAQFQFYLKWFYNS